jgi:hypothetical protein
MHAGRIHAGRILAGRLHAGRIHAARILSVLCIAGSGALVGSSHGFDLWSTKDSFMGSGQFIGPGANTAEQPLFPVIIRNMLFTTNVDFITPFKNNAALGDTICALRETQSADHSHLSDGTQVNDNVDTCSAVIAGTKMAVAIVNGGPFQGEQKTVTTLKDGNVIMTMDIALDLGIGPKGVIRLPFFGTTGSVTIPKSMQTQMGGKGTDQAGKYPSGTVLTGRDRRDAARFAALSRSAVCAVSQLRDEHSHRGSHGRRRQGSAGGGQETRGDVTSRRQALRSCHRAQG